MGNNASVAQVYGYFTSSDETIACWLLNKYSIIHLDGNPITSLDDSALYVELENEFCHIAGDIWSRQEILRDSLLNGWGNTFTSNIQNSHKWSKGVITTSLMKRKPFIFVWQMRWLSLWRRCPTGEKQEQ